ncbi:hypothetical protein KR52_10335 [Synechococcus sp. KORDI-52]|nr:hypothetical protein KR52_10335 [Synechococcus sp. KORDI-52]
MTNQMMAVVMVDQLLHLHQIQSSMGQLVCLMMVPGSSIGKRLHDQ